MDRRFRASRRLRRRQEFQRAYASGTRAHGRLMTVFLLPREDANTRLGIAATKKLGGAVQRNRAKRLIREMFRQHPSPAGLDIVVVPRPALVDASLAAIEADYASCLKRHTRAGRRG
jgi:ribonuclease P protein component